MTPRYLLLKGEGQRAKSKSLFFEKEGDNKRVLGKLSLNIRGYCINSFNFENKWSFNLIIKLTNQRKKYKIFQKV